MKNKQHIEESGNSNFKEEVNKEWIEGLNKHIAKVWETLEIPETDIHKVAVSSLLGYLEGFALQFFSIKSE